MGYVYVQKKSEVAKVCLARRRRPALFLHSRVDTIEEQELESRSFRISLGAV